MIDTSACLVSDSTLENSYVLSESMTSQKPVPFIPPKQPVHCIGIAAAGDPAGKSPGNF